MTDDTLFRAVGEIDDELLLETETFLNQNKPKQSAARWVRWGAAAACLLLAVSAVAYGQLHRGTPDTAANKDVGTEVSAAPTAPAVPTIAAAPNKHVTELHWNENALAEKPDDTSAFIALLWEDFVPMTYGEILDYFGVTLPVEEALPGLTLDDENSGCAGDRFGLYRKDNGSVYFGGNTFHFSSEDGARSFTASLGTGFVWSYAKLDGEPLEFTRLKGWDLALFLCPNGEFYTEFRQNGVDHRVSASGLTEEEFTQALLALLEEKNANDGLTTIQGTVTHVQSEHHYYYDHDVLISEEWIHDYIMIQPDEGQGDISLHIWVPGEADRYTKGERVEVTFTGEPATIGNIWPGQLTEVTPVE